MVLHPYNIDFLLLRSMLVPKQKTGKSCELFTYNLRLVDLSVFLSSFGYYRKAPLLIS